MNVNIKLRERYVRMLFYLQYKFTHTHTHTHTHTVYIYMHRFFNGGNFSELMVYWH